MKFTVPSIELQLWALLITLPKVFALPSDVIVRDNVNLEWTALGDSYASGVGAGSYISNSYRCLRYDKAYPMQMNATPSLAPGQHTINNCVCSGAKISDVEDYQFYDEDQWGKPSWQYGTRPKFGNPQFATLSIGGDNIDFPGILFNCILDTALPVGDTPEKRTCDEQRAYSWSQIQDPQLVTNISDIIQKIVTKGRSGTVGHNFKLFVIGYAEFFNETDPGCNNITFARTANPKPDNKNHTKMTTNIRKDFNKMSRDLNTAIQAAVKQHLDIGVEYVDIQTSLDGHRFCEEGIKEPDQNNPKLWFYHYPYDIAKDDPAYTQIFTDAYHKATQGLNNNADLNAKFPTTNLLWDAVLNAVDEIKLAGASSSDSTKRGVWDSLWGGSVGPRTKVFHPQIPFHADITGKIIKQYHESPTSPSPRPSPVSVPEKLDCKPVGGNTWVSNRDIAISNINDFCSQNLRSVEYNQGTSSDLIYTVNYPLDPSKTPKDAPDCHNRLANIVIDGCDGNDAVNNYQNYKYGGTYTATDGWVYMMEPKAVHEVTDGCEMTSYVFFDEFEIRGKNFPDAKLGVDGAGLLEQIQGCAGKTITAWSFVMTPNDPNFEWYARGNIVDFQGECIGHALETAGGNSPGHCQ